MGEGQGRDRLVRMPGSERRIWSWLSCRCDERAAMALTVDQIVEETRSWSDAKLLLLVHQLERRLHDVEPRIEEAWIAEAHRRIEEIEAGKSQLVPGEDVTERIRCIVGR